MSKDKRPIELFNFIDIQNRDSYTRIPVVRQLSLLAVVLFLLFGGALTPAYIHKHFIQQNKQTDQQQNHAANASVATMAKQTTAPHTDPFAQVQITGKAAYVLDTQAQKALFAQNADESLPLASVTKLMTMLIAQETLDKDHDVSIGTRAIEQEGDSGFTPGETFNRLSLSDLSLMSSSNDGAYAMAAAVGAALSPTDPELTFVKAMNIRAKELGLTNTRYLNPTGLDLSKTQAGAFGSAKDMTHLMEYIIKNQPDILTYTQQDNARFYNEAGRYHDADNTNYYVDSIPGLIGSKTGYTDLAGGNLVIAFDAGLNHPIVIAVLGSTYQDRFSDVLTLVRATQKYVAQTE